ncbi:hypothetical protein B5P44_00930 [Mycobacterium sp. CBMA 213]|nr:hypothetical protein [Mycolicibacterium sp. CBMA 335]MUM03384.1 hypothetical protein [Mycolicibacterium sp. CBMA 213]
MEPRRNRHWAAERERLPWREHTHRIPAPRRRPRHHHRQTVHRRPHTVNVLARGARHRYHPGVDSDSRSKTNLDYAYGSGQGFSTLTDALCWPHAEAIRFLCKRRSAICISQQDVSEFTDRWKLVYSKWFHTAACVSSRVVDVGHKRVGCTLSED